MVYKGGFQFNRGKEPCMSNLRLVSQDRPWTPRSLLQRCSSPSSACPTLPDPFENWPNKSLGDRLQLLAHHWPAALALVERVVNCLLAQVASGEP